jgi:hypothetical protein
MKYRIYQQDVMKWAETYQKEKFHALISDAPYHLTSIVKRFGKKDAAPAQYGTDGVFARSSKGFMGQTWDGGDVAFRPETWQALGEHLYDGAFGMVFSASRNWHRLAVAIEDAGFILHPTIFGWLQGQGFPKATRIDHKVDYHDGSQNWTGHRDVLQALKPAVEPILVFQKPYNGRPLDNIVATGAGALNIDGGRVPVDAPVIINRFTDGAKPWGNAKGEKFDTVSTSQGRWPANFILDDDAASRLGDPSSFFYNVQEQIDDADPIYYCGKVSPKERNEGLEDLPEVDYAVSSGATKAIERGQDEYLQNSIGLNRIRKVNNPHPTLKPIVLAQYLSTLLLPPQGYAPRRILVPFSGVSSEMIGCMNAGWERIVGIEFTPEYVDIAYKRMEYWKNKGNFDDS